jgi:hypothetical protein
MKTKMFAVAASALSLAVSTPSFAAIYAPVPTANYIQIGGLDWAWASPCAFAAPTCSPVDMTFQSTQGWRIPTLTEFLARPKVSDFASKCASAWFSSDYAHCDFGDPEYGAGVNGAGQPMGYLYDFGYNVTQNGLDPVADTWLVRGAGNGVPEPAAWAMMLAGFGLVGSAMRRRQKVAVSFA